MKRKSKSGGRQRPKRQQMQMERLEARQLFSRDDAFASVGSLTFSFAPDGTPVGEHTSRLFDRFDEIASSAEWQIAIAKGLQKWVSQSNINFGIVEDNGASSGVYGPTRGDERFGDVRLTGFDFSTDTYAEAVSELARSVGTWAGDVFFNTAGNWGNVSNIEAAALHEVGHILGLEHSENPDSVMHAHGPSGALNLIAEDISRLQAIHGVRVPDANEDNQGNGSIARATEIKGGHGDSSVTSGFSGSQVWAQFGDLTTSTDRDVYLIRIDSSYSGPLAVEVRSAGISLARLKVSLTDEAGTLLTSSAINGSFGGSAILELPHTTRGAKIFLHVEAGAEAFWSTGDYGITVASPQRFLQNGSEIADWLRLAHRWYYDSDHVNDGFSWHLNPLPNSQPDLDAEVHTDDISSKARLLTPSLVTTARTLFQFVGTISDQTDVDHLRVKTPSSFSGPLELTADIESLKVGGLVPQAEILDRDGKVVPSVTRVRGYGQYQIVATDVELNREYTVRIKASPGGESFRLGNYSLFVTLAAPATPPEIFVSGTLSQLNPIVEREWFVARPQLFALSLEGFSSSLTSETPIWLSVYDEQKKLVSGLMAPIGELRTSPGILLDPGTYYIQVAFAVDTVNPIDVDFKVTGDQPSSPIGPLLGTTGVAPKFLCPGETDIYCYPGTTIPTPKTTAIGNPPSITLPTPILTPTQRPPDLWYWENIFLPTNPTNPLDTNGDQFITPIDALVIINRLNLVGVGAYPPPPTQIGFLDSNADGNITPLDVLIVINYLNLVN